MKNQLKIAFLLAATWVIAACGKDEKTLDAPLAADAMEVRGNLVDIRTLEAGEKVFPQHNGYVFGADAGNLFEEPAVYAAGLMESRGVEAFRCGSAGVVRMATDCADMQAEGWSRTDDVLMVGDIPYHVYTHTYTTPGRWTALPDPAGRKYTTLLFARQLRVADVRVPGTVIAQVPELRGWTISNVSLVILPDGRYLASCTGVAEGASLFVSEDRGATWRMLVENVTAQNGIANYYNLFLFGGKLHMMGCGRGGADLMIARSEDGGLTWTEPTVILQGGFHSAVVPVAVHDGRIWRACETRGSDTSIKRPFVVSAPADADLLDAASWTKSDNLITDAEITVDGKTVTELIEGNVVAAPDGKLYNILRASSKATSQLAARVLVENERTLRFTPSNDMITLPGGGKKFTIRYDDRSKRYWALTNPASSNMKGQKHNGIYANGITCDLVRNRLVLCYSTDLSTWVQYKEIAYDPDPFFHGFQYVDWVFDGDDIVAVCRMACPESRGLPVRQHDANLMSFFRIGNFRTLGASKSMNPQNR